MKLPAAIRRRLARWIYRAIGRRPPNFVLKDDTDGTVYLQRWHIIPPNPFLSLYVHLFVGPDQGRHLHDHRSGTLSVILDGWYEEEVSTPELMRRDWRGSWLVHRKGGDIVYRSARTPHMVTQTGGALTIFLTGPTTRDWGFWVDGRWVPHCEYLAAQTEGPK